MVYCLWYKKILVYRKEKKTMEYTTTEAAKNMHEAYLKCKTVFDPKLETINDMVDFESEEETFFYKTVSDFFIQRKQMKIIKQEKYGK